VAVLRWSRGAIAPPNIRVAPPNLSCLPDPPHGQTPLSLPGLGAIAPQTFGARTATESRAPQHNLNMANLAQIRLACDLQVYLTAKYSWRRLHHKITGGGRIWRRYFKIVSIMDKYSPKCRGIGRIKAAIRRVCSSATVVCTCTTCSSFSPKLQLF
jgi:hypothetical protein